MAARRQALEVRLARAVSEADGQAVEAVTGELIDDIRGSSKPYSDKAAHALLGQLRGIREFGLMQQMSDALIQSGQDSFQVRRQYAQSLLDQGNITSAIDALNKLAKDAKGRDRREHLEAQGLLGRAYKQLYVEAKGKKNDWVINALKQGVSHYYQAYSDDPKELWHGINAVALLQRAKADGVGMKKYPDPKDLAAGILRTIQRKDSRKRTTTWDLATAAEASVALGDYDQALAWANRFVADRDLTAFHVGSFERQLREVWGLDPTEGPGSRILPVVRAQLLAREGGRIDVSGTEVEEAPLNQQADEKQLEKVLGRTGVKSYRWWLNGLSRARGVARIGYDIDRGEGTGFLLPAQSLHPSLGAGFLLLTNAHVVSADPGIDALRPDEVVVTFEAGEGGAEQYRVAEVIFSDPPGGLDTTIVRLDQEVSSEQPYPVSRRLPSPNKARVYVIGHPQGGTLSFSIQDNLLIDHKDPLLHYRAPTEPGSSGSPIFNARWELIGIHHAGGHQVRKLRGEGTYAANEGIWIESILGAVARKFS